MLVWLRVMVETQAQNSQALGKPPKCIATTSVVTISSQSPVARVLFSPAKYFKGPTSKKTYRSRALDLPYQRIKLKSFKFFQVGVEQQKYITWEYTRSGRMIPTDGK